MELVLQSRTLSSYSNSSMMYSEKESALQCDRGKGVPSFDEIVDFALVEVDFDDPTTNVRGRRALAIAKPTPRGY